MNKDTTRNEMRPPALSAMSWHLRLMPRISNEMLREGKDVVIVDADPTRCLLQTGTYLSDQFAASHSMNQQTTRHLDREALYVTYCDGIGCNASTKRRIDWQNWDLQ